MFITSYTSLTPSRGLIKLPQYTCLLHSFIMICFCFLKRSHYFYFHFKKAKIKRKKCGKDFLLHINNVSKHRYLISKYHWKSRKSFIKLAFSFLSIGSKTKTRNWRKTVYNMLIGSYISITPRRGLLKLLQYIYLLHSLIRICFCF